MLLLGNPSFNIPVAVNQHHAYRIFQQELRWGQQFFQGWLMKNPYFPMFVRDWLCSRRVLSMSGDAVKAYLYLLCESWLQEPRATLPNDDKELASMARMSKGDFTAIKSEIMQHYVVGTCEEHNGRLFQDTLLEISRKSESKQRIGNKNAKQTQNEHKKTQSERKVNAGPEYEYESESDVESVTCIKAFNILNDQPLKKEVKKFVPPSLIEVIDYCADTGAKIDPESFIAFYESKGWKIGNNPMKDWKAAVRTWVLRSKKDSTQPRATYGRQEVTKESIQAILEMELPD